jgi:hypothetical protein
MVGITNQDTSLRAALVALVIAAPTAASAFDVAETAFEVYHTENGVEVSESTTQVPLRTDNETCWNWYIRTPDTSGSVTFTERLVMPEAPESWGDLNDIPEGQIGKLVLEDGGRIGISTRKADLSDGWFGHGWCILPGDPVGPHTVEVSVEGEVIHRFDFEVVAPPEAPPPTRVIRRSERSGRFSL